MYVYDMYITYITTQCVYVVIDIGIIYSLL